MRFTSAQHSGISVSCVLYALNSFDCTVARLGVSGRDITPSPHKLNILHRHSLNQRK